MDILSSLFSTTKGPNSFQLFSPIHFAIIIFISILAILTFNMKKESKLFIRVLTTLAIIDQICFYGWYFINTPTELLEYGLFLFHCTLAILVVLLATLTKNNKLAKYGSYWGLFGSIAAIVFPATPFYYPSPHIVQISHFTMHTYLLLFSIYHIFIRKLGMNNDDYEKICLITAIYNFFLLIFNAAFKTNYGFVSAPPFDIGINLPVIICYLLTTLTFIIAFTLEYMLLNDGDFNSIANLPK